MLKYTTRTELIDNYKNLIKDMMSERMRFNEDLKDKEYFEEIIQDDIFEMIDSLQEVIYTYEAKEVSKIIRYYDAFDTSDITGERFDNWSQVAFENIYQLIYENINIEELYNELIKE